MDNFYFALRLACGAIAIYGGGALLYGVIIGHARSALARSRRAENPKAYWIGVARLACLVAGMALAATVVPDRQMGPVVFLSFFLPGLAAALMTGRFQWEADNKRIDSPHRFWGWVALYACLILMMTVMFIWP